MLALLSYIQRRCYRGLTCQIEWSVTFRSGPKFLGKSAENLKAGREFTPIYIQPAKYIYVVCIVSWNRVPPLKMNDRRCEWDKKVIMV